MTTTIYGVSGSRAIRSLWAIEEVGLEYTHVATHFFNDSKTDDYLSVNPNGRIPALVDGDITLFESMAINLYLTKKYAPALYPVSEGEQAKAIQWSVWAISEIEPQQMQIVIQKFFNRDNMDQAIIDTSTENLKRPLDVLNQHLADRKYLLGDAFTVADLNVSGVMLLMQMMEFDLSAYPNIQNWTEQCYRRDALKRAQSLA
ncbi:MAG: glutathione S-transferase family protein [Pseudomonadales bacterium]|jgi:glutathione S-transferase|tara:strand:+ start:7153 stop:7758 length:606 start_codon:yes stop_codon:yes gene_type:complete